MTSVILSPKFQIVIPEGVRKLFKLVPGQAMHICTVGDRIDVTPKLPMRDAGLASKPSVVYQAKPLSK